MPYEETGNRYGRHWRGRTTATQRRPYNHPLPYNMRSGTWVAVGSEVPPDIRNDIPLANGFDIDGGGGVTEATNKALKKVYTRMNQAESLLVAWKERQKAIDLVTSNVRRLVTIARAVKRRDPKIVRAVLKRNPNAKDIIKQPAGLWLEYHFGVVPTIMDIHHSMSVLGFEFPVDKFSFSSKATRFTQSGKGTYAWYEVKTLDSCVKIGGEIYGLNPDVHLATMLGFGQPLSVAWEMTPFSWFVDYFVNVGDMVKNLEPRFPGVKVRNQYTTRLVKASGHTGYRNREPISQIKFDVYKGVYMSRTTGWPSFQLEFKSPLDLKGQQCSYVVAVLTQLLTGMKKK